MPGTLNRCRRPAPVVKAMKENRAPMPTQSDPVDPESVESKLPRPSKERLQAAIGARLGAHLRLVWLALAVTCLFFAISHLAVLPPRIRWIMFAIAAGSSALFAVSTVWIGHRRIAGPKAIMLGGLTALVLWLNATVHLFLLQESWNTTNLIIILVATAMLLLDRRWFLCIAALSAGAWIAAVILLPRDPHWMHFGFALVSSEVMAMIIHFVRVGDLSRIEGLRIAEEEHKAQLELSLQDARLRLASIWQNSREGLVISDETGRLVAVNRATARLVGMQEADLPGRRWFELLSKDSDLSAAERVYSEVFENPESVSTEEREVVLVTGRRLWLATSHLRLPLPDGQHQLLTLIRNVTERRRFDEDRLVMEHQVQEAQRLESLGMLAGGIAHDFNNLLAGILGNLELMRAQLSPQADAYQNIVQAETAAKRAADLCNQMLAYAGRGRFAIEDLDLNTLVRETAGLLSASLPKMTRLELDLAPQLPGLRADGSQLRQIVMNLVINSAEAIGDSPGVINISTRIATPEDTRSAVATVTKTSADSLVCLEVRDDGCGMAPEIRTRIFDPFFSTKFTGRGLGLAAVVGIVRSHGGGLSVESMPGRGSTFRILLPALDRPAPHSAHETGGTDAWRGEGTVLVVDDEPVIRQVLCSLLEGLGFHALMASDGIEGIEIMHEHAGSVRLILLDLTMPRMDGRRTLEALRHFPASPPVILMSGYTEDETLQRLADERLAGFLQKPFDLEQLTARIRDVLSPVVQDTSANAPRAT